MLSKNSKSVIVNYLYNYLYQILLLIIPFITAPYISRVFGTEVLGEYTYSFTIANYFVIFSMLGINNYGNRTIAQCRDDAEKLSQNFSEIYSIQLISSIASLFLYGLFCITFVPRMSIKFYIINVIYIFSSVFDVNWLLFGIEKFKLTVIRNLIVKIVLTISIFVFVKNENDIYVYALLVSISYVITNLCVFPYVSRIVRFHIVEKSDLRRHIKPVLILFVPVIAVSIYKYIDKIMIGNIVSMSEVTIYEYSQKILNIPAGVYGALGTVMLPKISNLISQNDEGLANRYTEISLVLVGLVMPAMALGLAAIVPEFSIMFYGDGFERCGTVIQMMVPMLIFISANNVIRTQVLLPYERDSSYVLALGLGAICNVVLNAIFIPIYGAVGAAIGTVAAEMTVFIYQVVKSKDLIRYKNYFITVILSFVYGLLMFFLLRIMSIEIDEIYLLLIRIVVGMLWYIVPSVCVIKLLKRRKSGER